MDTLGLQVLLYALVDTAYSILYLLLVFHASVSLDVALRSDM
jgi:hypothetical protein